MLTLFVVGYNTLDFVNFPNDLLNKSEFHVVFVQCWFVGFFFAIAEVNYHCNKYLGQNSTDTLEIKRTFVRCFS